MAYELATPLTQFVLEKQRREAEPSRVTRDQSMQRAYPHAPQAIREQIVREVVFGEREALLHESRVHGR